MLSLLNLVNVTSKEFDCKKFKVEIDFRKEIFFFDFFLIFECVFGILLVFEQKHVLKHKCAVLLFRFSEVFEI